MSQTTQKQYDFTKRKRWADLLVTELTDGINFVLSTSCTILYCGPAVTELIGWRDSDLVDHDMLDLVIPDDRATFHMCFQESVNKDSDLLVYVRFRRKEAILSSSNAPPNVDSKDMLFEVKGHPRIHHSEMKLLFATAKPYPGRSIAMLNSFLELKVENEGLQRRLRKLQSYQLTGHSSPSFDGTSPNPSLRLPPPTLLLPRGTDALGPHESSTWRNFEPPSLTNNADEPPNNTSSPEGDDPNDEGSKKKKAKKSHGQSNQYVCTKCGKTESPEWRKGPRGPKTLCNACGLRWAKQMKKDEDPLPENDVQS